MFRLLTDLLPNSMCAVLNHPHNHVRERTDKGEMGYRCQGCFIMLPNTVNSITGGAVETDYKPGKARLIPN